MAATAATIANAGASASFRYLFAVCHPDMAEAACSGRMHRLIEELFHVSPLQPCQDHLHRGCSFCRHGTSP